jgi:acyl-[acyl carrier protein]--UDP-N-acetylglucosamine O-acyltransferase
MSRLTCYVTIHTIDGKAKVAFRTKTSLAHAPKELAEEFKEYTKWEWFIDVLQKRHEQAINKELK